MFARQVLTSSPEMNDANRLQMHSIDAEMLRPQSSPLCLERRVGFTARRRIRLAPVVGRRNDWRRSIDSMDQPRRQPVAEFTTRRNLPARGSFFSASVSSQDGTSSSSTSRRRSGKLDDCGSSVGGVSRKSCDRELWMRRSTIVNAIRHAAISQADAVGSSRRRHDSVSSDSNKMEMKQQFNGRRCLDQNGDVRYETGRAALERCCQWRREEDGLSCSSVTMPSRCVGCNEELAEIGVSTGAHHQQHQQQERTWSVFSVPRMDEDDGGITTITPSEALRYASAYGQLHRVRQLLVEQTVSGRDQDGFTALHLAVINKHAEIVSLLVNDNFGLLEMRDKSGRTALHHATALGYADIVYILLQAGSQVDRRCGDEVGNCSVHLAAQRGFSATLQQLVIHQADVQICNQNNSTALHMAAQNGHNQSARILLFAGGNPNAKNNFGDTPLHTAARYGHAGVASILINARSKVNVQNKNGDTSLHIAAALKRRKITNILIEARIDCDLRNKQGERAVDVATRKEHCEIISLLNQKVSKSKRKVDALGNIHSSAELITVATSGEKKKNQFLSFFSRRKKSKKVDVNTGSELTSPDDLIKIDDLPSTQFDVNLAAERAREFARTQSWRDRFTKGVDRQVVEPMNDVKLSPANESHQLTTELPGFYMAAPLARIPRSSLTVPVDLGHRPEALKACFSSDCRHIVGGDSKDATISRSSAQRQHQLTHPQQHRQQHRQRLQVPAEVHCRREAGTPRHEDVTRRRAYDRCVGDDDEHDQRLSRCRSDDTLSTTSGAVCYPDSRQRSNGNTIESLDQRQGRVQVVT